jgi:hypothetical protein
VLGKAAQGTTQAAAKPAQPPLPSRTQAAQAQHAATAVFGAPQPPRAAAPQQQQQQPAQQQTESAVDQASASQPGGSSTEADEAGEQTDDEGSSESHEAEDVAVPRPEPQLQGTTILLPCAFSLAGTVC